MTEIKTRGLGGIQHGLDSFVKEITEKGLELADGSKFLQQNMPETYKAVKKARTLYKENKFVGSGKSREVRGRAAQAIAMVVDGLGQDTTNKLNKLWDRINPFKKRTVQNVPVSRGIER